MSAVNKIIITRWGNVRQRKILRERKTGRIIYWEKCSVGVTIQRYGKQLAKRPTSRWL